MKSYYIKGKEGDLGDLRRGKKIRIFFLMGVEGIREIETVCGCTRPKIKDKGIEVLYTVENIPYHLRDSNKGYEISKKLYLIYNSGYKSFINFKGRVKG